MIKNSRLLIDEPILTFQPSLAKTIGLNGAIFLQQLQYWLKISEQRGEEDKYFEGRWWVYNSYPEWVRNNFPFWSVRTIERTIDFLEHELYVVLSRPDPALAGRKWYTIDYAVLERLDTLPPQANAENARELAPTPTELVSAPLRIIKAAPAGAHVRRHARRSGYRIPRQNGKGSPRQSDETPLVRMARPPSSI